jgi:hypothetical protein
MDGERPRTRGTTAFIRAARTKRTPYAVRSVRPDGVAGEARSRGDARAVAPFVTPAVGAADEPLGDMGGVIRA